MTGGRYYGNGKFLMQFLLRFLLLFIKIYYGYYGILRVLQNITDITEHYGYYRILRILQNITDITEYYGILQNITVCKINPALYIINGNNCRTKGGVWCGYIHVFP